MFTNLILFGILNEIQDYLESDFSFPLLNSTYNMNGKTFQKCYYYSQDLQFEPDLLKRIGISDKQEFFALLFRRNSIQLENYRSFTIRAYDKEFIQTLVDSGLLPKDYSGKVRMVNLTLQVKPYSNVTRYVYEFEENFLLDWVGHGSIDINIPLNSEVTLTTKLGYSCEPFQEILKENPSKKVFTGSFEINLEFPLVKLSAEKYPLIKDINEIVYA